jgi:hypothetical protein
MIYSGAALVVRPAKTWHSDRRTLRADSHETFDSDTLYDRYDCASMAGTESKPFVFWKGRRQRLVVCGIYKTSKLDLSTKRQIVMRLSC